MESFLQIATAVYFPITAACVIGILFSKGLKQSGRKFKGKPIQEIIPDFLARALYLVGIPIGVANFIRKAEFNSTVWLSPVIAWAAVLLAILLCWLFIKSSNKAKKAKTKASFMLLSYLGNTSYLGFPVILLLPQLGPRYFSSAVLYDILGTLLAGYGLGVFIARQANRMSQSSKGDAIPSADNKQRALATTISEANPSKLSNQKETSTGLASNPLLDSLVEIVKNPTFYAFFIGLFLKTLTIADWLVAMLNAIAWASIMIALFVMGMRIQQLSSKIDFRLAIQPVAIKTILVPLITAAGLTVFGFDGPQRLVLVLQASMPCAFVSLILAENYDLDVELTVASILLSCIVFAFTLPIWTSLFTTW